MDYAQIYPFLGISARGKIGNLWIHKLYKERYWNNHPDYPQNPFREKMAGNQGRVITKYYYPFNPRTPKQQANRGRLADGMYNWKYFDENTKIYYNQLRLPVRSYGLLRYLQLYLSANSPMIIYWETLEQSAENPMRLPEYMASEYFAGVNRIGAFNDYPAWSPYGSLRYRSDLNKFMGFKKGVGWEEIGAGGPGGGVSEFIFNDANGISGVVDDPTSTPALTLALGAITPSNINGLPMSADTTDFYTKIGIDSGLNLAAGAEQNTFVGYHAGQMGITSTNAADYNTALGAYALEVLTTGGSNIAIGANALKLNTTGDSNTVIGAGAFRNNVAGSYNVAIGTYSMGQLNDGRMNTCVGYNAMAHGVNCSENVALGTYALMYNHTASHNTGIGQEALYKNYVGDENTAVGYEALYNTKGTSGEISSISDYSGSVAGTVLAYSYQHGLSTGNTVTIEGTVNYNGTYSITVVGSNYFYFTHAFSITEMGAWYIGTGGTYNTAIGSKSGYSNILGEKNTFLGYLAGNHASQKTDAINSTAIGANVYTTASNQVVIGDTNITETVLRGEVKIPTLTVSTVVNLNDINIVLGTATGTKIGTGTNQKLAFYNSTPIVRVSEYTQTYSTASKTVPNATASNPPAGGTGITAGAYNTAANRNLMITSLTNCIADVAALKQVVNSIIDDLQAYGLFS